MARVRGMVGGLLLAAVIVMGLAGTAVADPVSALPGLPGGASGGGLVSVSQLPDGLAPAVSRALGGSAAPGPGSSSGQELQAPDGAPGDFFGYNNASVSSLDASGDLALVGAPAKDGGKGAAYVFVRQGGSWVEEQELQAADGGGSDEFGYSVSLSDNGRVALIAAPGKDGFKGAAYVFVRQGDTYVQEQELQAADGAPGDEFGFSVSLSDSGQVALIGAVLKDGAKGAAYVFVREGDTYVQEQELQAADGTPVDEFGFSVSLSDSGQVALVGAPVKDGFKGAAYVFVRQGDTYVQEQELQAANGTPGDQFGASVSLSDSGRVALIGAPVKDDLNGAAYVFARQGDTYVQEQELHAADGTPGDAFGSSVSLSDSGRVALIGALGKDGYKGAAYVFVRQGDTYAQEQELQAPDAAPGDLFGFSVSLSDTGRVALIGAPGKDGYKGAAYVFDGVDAPGTG